MIESPYSLYKLIILYMLKKVTFPLTRAQISDFVVGEGYTSYFHLQEVLAEMEESHLLKTEHHGHMTYYSMDEQGRQTLDFFENEISPEIRRDIANYLVLHSYEMRSDSSTLADYFRTADQNYCVHCSVREGRETLIELKFTVPTETAAQTLAENWKQKSTEAYEALLKVLM